MRTLGIITGFLIFGLPVVSQQNQIITEVPNLEITELRLADQNGNMTIEANETCDLMFLLKNSGGADAVNIKIKLTLLGSDNLDIKYRKSRTLSLLKSNSGQEIKFPIAAKETVTEGLAEFKIEIQEGNGFDAYPVNLEIKTIQGNLLKKAITEERLADLEQLEETSRIVMVNLRFADQNQNNILEVNETSYLQFRLFNITNEVIDDIQVYVELKEASGAGINYPNITSLGTFTPLEFRDISIPVKGKRNLTGGQAVFAVYLWEEGGTASNHQTLNVNTREYEIPVLKISSAEFSGQDGKELSLNEPINFTLVIENSGTGSAYDIDVEPRVTSENVRLVQPKGTINIEELPGGESKKLNFQFVANKRYLFPNIPVILGITENFNGLYLDTMIIASIRLPERKKVVKPDSVIVKTDSGPDIQPEEIKAQVTPVALPNLELHGMEFVDQDKNNIIDHKESCSINFYVNNAGAGAAKDVTVVIKQLNSAIPGLSFPGSIFLGELEPQQETLVSIPIRSTENLPSDLAEFKIDVLESMGLDAVPLLLQVETRKPPEPNLLISRSEFRDESGQLRRNYPIELRITVKNSGPGSASDIKVQFELPDANCVLLGETAEFDVKKLNSGESGELSLLFTATRRYTEENIPVKVGISESSMKYGLDTVLVGNLNEEMQAITKLEVQPRIIEPLEETRALGETRGGGDPLKNLGYEEAIREMKIGRYFALIIGINDYSGVWPPLKNAVRDAQSVEDLLRSKYKFDHFTAIYNDLATRENIIRELEWHVRNVTPDDNILIFFSGHGEFKKELNKGYWVPVEAKTNSTFEYISNSELQTFLSAINSRHTLLISDACFSGDIFRGNTISIPFDRSERYYRTVHVKTSRQAITSGGLEPVMDGGRDGHSVFSYYLLKSLNTNEDRFFDASQLYNDLKIPVVNNSNQSPEIQQIENTGDEGGQFIFILK